MPTQLPDYDLSLNKAVPSEDTAALLQNHNINAEELVEYINSIKSYVQENVGNDTSGTTPSQVHDIILASKQIITLPVVWTSNTLPIDATNPELGTMTRTINPTGSVTVVITNVKNSKQIVVQCRTLGGEIVRPKITLTTAFVTVFFARQEDLAATPGWGGTSANDPNIKEILIF